MADTQTTCDSVHKCFCVSCYERKLVEHRVDVCDTKRVG